MENSEITVIYNFIKNNKHTFDLKIYERQILRYITNKCFLKVSIQLTKCYLLLVINTQKYCQKFPFTYPIQIKYEYNALLLLCIHYILHLNRFS